MSCRIQRNRSGEIIKVTDRFGRESDLYHSINKVLDDGLHPDLAYAVYLESTAAADEVQLSGEPKVSGKIVTNILKKVDSNFSTWKEAGAHLKAFEADTSLENSIHYFLQKVGVSVRTVPTLKNEKGEDINAMGLANLTNKLIYLAETSDTSTLTEEAAHFLVEILNAKDSPLYKSMYNMIESFQEFKDVANPKGFYYKKYEGNIDMLKREAIAKVITRHLVNGDVKNETKEKLSRLQRWWDRVLKVIKDMFGGTSTNPFLDSAKLMFNDNLEAAINASPESVKLSGTFYQDKTVAETLSELEKFSNLYEAKKMTLDQVSSRDFKKYFTKLLDKDGKIERYVGKGPYAGKMLKIRSSDAATLEYNKKNPTVYIAPEESKRLEENAKTRMEIGTAGHLIMEKLVDIVFHKKGSIGALIRSSASFKESHIKQLHKSMLEIKKQLDAQQKIINSSESYTVLSEQFISDEKAGMGGTIDLLVLYSDNTAAIYDYKFKGAWSAHSKWNKTSKTLTVTGDMYASSIEGYDSQLGGYKTALLSKYGVRAVRQSRIVPVAVRYKMDDGILSDSIEGISVWTGDVVNDSEYLDHIPVAEEETGDAAIDALVKSEIRRYKKMAKAHKQAAFKDKEALEARMATSRSIISSLQMNREVRPGLREASRIVKKVNRGVQEQDAIVLDKNGEEVVNHKYLTFKEMRDMLKELKHFQAFTSLTDIRAELEKSNTKESKKLLEDLNTSSGSISTAIATLRAASLQRLDQKAKEKGIKNFTYNRPQSKLNNYVNISAHASPYSRYINSVHQDIESASIKFEQKLAEEIQIEEDLLKEYALAKGISLRDAFEKIINPVTHNLHAKYNNKFYSDRTDAIAAGDITWYQKHHSVNKEYYDKVFTKWRKDRYSEIDKSYPNAANEAARQKDLWDKKYDVVKHKSAWLNYGGKYFLNINEETSASYISEDFVEISKTPELKRFYDYHVSKIKEFEGRFGMNLGHTFIANSQKGMLDSLLESENPWDTFTSVVADNFKVRSHNMQYGQQDTDGSFLRHIPRLYTAELTSEDEYGNEVIDRSLRSTELGRSLYLLGQAAIRYELKNNAVDELLLIETLLKDGVVEEVMEDAHGRAVSASFKKVKTMLSTSQSNADTFTDILDKVFFNRNIKTKDVVSSKNISLNQTLMSAKAWHITAALGLKAPVALGALGAGIIGIHTQGSKGIHFTNKEVMEAEAAILKGDPKVRALMDHFQLAVLDVSKRRGEMLSSSKRAKYMTGDRWFEFLAQADKMVDSVISVAMAKTHGINEDGKLKRLKQLPEGTISLWDSLEVADNPAYSKHGAAHKYKVTIKGETDAVFTNFRARIDEISVAVKGTASPSSVSIAGMNLINRLFLQYRSWLPGLAMERFGKLRYNHILEAYAQGTFRGFYGNFGPDEEFDDAGQLVTMEIELLDYLSTTLQDVGKIALDISTFGLTNTHKIKEGKARMEFERFLEDQAMNSEFEFASDPVEKEKQFQEFLEMKRGNLKGSIAELRAVLLLFMLMMALGGDWDEDGQADIRKTWAGRQLDNIIGRIYRETAVFYDLTEFTGPRASSMPLIGFVQTGMRVVDNMRDEIWDRVTGREGVETDDRSPVGIYTFSLAPGVGGIVKAAEIYPQHKTKR